MAKVLEEIEYEGLPTNAGLGVSLRKVALVAKAHTFSYVSR